MAAAAEVLTNSSTEEEWTVVLPRRVKRGRKLPRCQNEEDQQPWMPSEFETDPQRQSKLMQKMEIAVKKIESSQFYSTYLAQIQSPEILDHFHHVLGSDSKIQMVIYGIGSIESYETPRFQLSLAILMKRKFDWIGDIEVFDPVLSATESRVLKALGCSVLSVNEQGRREALKPTLFFMPHCEAGLYNNLLHANWRFDRLCRIALFGNRFQTYEQHVLLYKNSVIANSAKHILAVRRFTHEFGIETVSEDYFAAFHDSGWHFFSPGLESELPSIDS